MRQFLISVVLLLASFFADAQWYAYIGSGYNLRTPSQHNSTITDAHNYVYKNKYYSFGEGLNIKCGYGYLTAKNIGFELIANYCNSNKVKTAFDNWVFNTYSASSLQIIPSVKITTEIKKITAFAKIGFITGFCRINQDYLITGSTSSFEEKTIYFGGVALGINSSAGCEYTLNNSFKLFAEISVTGLVYTPTKSVSDDQLKEEGWFKILTTHYSGTLSDNANKIGSNASYHYRKLSYPFNSVGLNVGIIYFFNKSIK